MNAVKIGTFAAVNFAKEVTAPEFPHWPEFPGIAVIKASSEMGFLVWLNGAGGDRSRRVTVNTVLGDVTISQTFLTVGNFYGLHANLSKIAERELRANSDDLSDERYHQFRTPLKDRLVDEPIRDACRKLGITKLWKHSGDIIFPHPDVVVMNLEEKSEITIEAQC